MHTTHFVQDDHVEMGWSASHSLSGNPVQDRHRQQELHILVRSDATLRRDKWVDVYDIHFALRVESYRDAPAWLGGKGFREDVPDNDLRKMRLRSKSVAG